MPYQCNNNVRVIWNTPDKVFNKGIQFYKIYSWTERRKNKFMYKKKEATDTAEISNPNRKRTDMETNEKNTERQTNNWACHNIEN